MGRVCTPYGVRIRLCINIYRIYDMIRIKSGGLREKGGTVGTTQDMHWARPGRLTEAMTEESGWMLRWKGVPQGHV